MKGLTSKFVTAIVGAAFTAMPALATTTPAIDPDGSGGAEFNLGSLDWNVGNALAVGSIPGAGAVGSTFDTYFQAQLSVFNTTGGQVAPSGYEWTMIVGVTEVVTSTAGTTANFALAAAPTVNFLKIYYDAADNANDLAGTGFDDGTLILEADITSLASVFAIFGGGPGTPLDNFGADNYPAIDSVLGIGGTSASALISYFDPAFFTDLVDAASILNITLATTQQALNFAQVDPSAQFADGSGGAIIPSLGAINGITGPDFQFQLDLNQSFDTVVIPEPLTSALGFLGLGALGAVISRRRR